MFREVSATRPALVTLLLLLAGATPVGAQDDGVKVDPDSPAGTEYAIPLEEARDDASGGQKKSSKQEALFGEGVEREQAAPAEPAPAAPAPDASVAPAAPAPGESEKPGKKPDRDREESGEAASPIDPLAQSAQRSAAIDAAAAADDGSGLPLTAAIIAAVLAVALLAGFGLRAFLRRPDANA
jgi:hypothetical protein